MVCICSLYGSQPALELGLNYGQLLSSLEHSCTSLSQTQAKDLSLEVYFLVSSICVPFPQYISAGLLSVISSDHI